MRKGINVENGNKIGDMYVETGENPVQKNLIALDIKAEVKGESIHLQVPRYTSSSGWIVDFGLPPFNEFIRAPQLKSMEKKFKDPLTGYEEKIKVNQKGINGIKIKLERKKSTEEIYEMQEFQTPDGNSIGLMSVKHPSGSLKTVIERDIRHERNRINQLLDKLEKTEKNYLKNVKREEALPSIVIYKQVKIDGNSLPVHSNIFPFWNKQSFKEEKINILEIGYLDYGDNKYELDKTHGRWYKLYNFEDFDYPYLEIREGNWKSTSMEVNKEKVRLLKNYERYLYRIKT